MTFESFLETIDQPEAPARINVYCLALWHDAKGDWHKAHDLVDGKPGSKAAHVHAYLHRKEGDTWNADYWYSRAEKIRPEISLEEEWSILVKELLDE